MDKNNEPEPGMGARICDPSYSGLQVKGQHSLHGKFEASLGNLVRSQNKILKGLEIELRGTVLTKHAQGPRFNC
jgi:hypothetical protein